jgi:hypothetical protein
MSSVTGVQASFFPPGNTPPLRKLNITPSRTVLPEKLIFAQLAQIVPVDPKGSLLCPKEPAN